jgi:hypothetical protein
MSICEPVFSPNRRENQVLVSVAIQFTGPSAFSVLLMAGEAVNEREAAPLHRAYDAELNAGVFEI